VRGGGLHGVAHTVLIGGVVEASCGRCGMVAGGLCYEDPVSGAFVLSLGVSDACHGKVIETTGR
jgi:hypothetical protein